MENAPGFDPWTLSATLHLRPDGAKARATAPTSARSVEAYPVKSSQWMGLRERTRLRSDFDRTSVVARRNHQCLTVSSSFPQQPP